LVVVIWFNYEYIKTIPLTSEASTFQPSTVTSCFQGRITFAYDDVVDEGYFPSGETCWQIKCNGSTGRLIKSIVACEQLSRNSHTTPSPSGTSTDSEVKCVFNGKSYNPGKTFNLFFCM